MKKILILILNSCICFTLTAQCINTYPILTTDPAVTNQQSNGLGKVNNWDWTRDVYNDVYVVETLNGFSPVCNEITAPWNHQEEDNPNVEPLTLQFASNPNTLDIYPIDEWGLLSRNRIVKTKTRLV